MWEGNRPTVWRNCICQLWMKALPKKYCKGKGAPRTVILNLGHTLGSPGSFEESQCPGHIQELLEKKLRHHYLYRKMVLMDILVALCMSLSYLRKKYRQWITGFFGGYTRRNGQFFQEGQQSSLQSGLGWAVSLTPIWGLSGSCSEEDLKTEGQRVDTRGCETTSEFLETEGTWSGGSEGWEHGW